jgi:hypothetical protein
MALGGSVWPEIGGSISPKYTLTNDTTQTVVTLAHVNAPYTQVIALGSIKGQHTTRLFEADNPQGPSPENEVSVLPATKVRCPKLHYPSPVAA